METMNKPYIPLHIASYVIMRSNELGYEINNLKLQKILYFLQAEYLTESGKRLFDETMEKWKYGPVTPSVYHEYKTFGANAILTEDIKTIIRLPKGDEKPNFFNMFIKEDLEEIKIAEEDKQIVDDLLRKIGNEDAFSLVRETHEHEIWQNDKGKILSGQLGIKYEDDEIANYFKNSESRKKW